MKKTLALVLVFVMMFALCVNAFAEEKDEYDVRVLVWKFDDTYGSSVRQAMMKYADEIGEELGVKINLQLYDAADDFAKQLEQANQIVGENPDFVIINLAEVASGETLTKLFTEAGIPFLFYNKPPTDESFQAVIGDTGSIFVGTLAREAGDMQGEIIADIWAADQSIDLNGDGVLQFVELEGEVNNAEAQQRTQYSEETAVELGVPLEPALDEYIIVANWDTAQAQEKFAPVFAANPEIEVVFVNNDDMGIGVLAALNDKGYNTGKEGDPKLVVIGVDATDAAYEAIRAGKMTATVKQDGDAMGKANIEIMMNYLLTGSWLDGLDYEYQPDGMSVYIPYAKVTAENVG